MALTKTIIAEQIQNNLNLSRTATYDIMEEFLEIIKETIENGEDIRISNLLLVANALDLSIQLTAK